MKMSSNERIQEIKEILEKQHGREFTWEEACEAERTLIGLAEICYDHWKEQVRRDKKLEESPKGFHLEGVGYSCSICGGSASQEQSWYDKYGIKCMTCQRAIDRKEIPASLAKNKDAWYSKYDLEYNFNLKGPKLREWIKKGIIHVRTVTHESGGAHYQLFLIKDNKDFLPPKNLLKSHTVKETKEGKDWYHIEPWYRFVDPFEHLKGYKIMNYMKVTEGKE